MRQADLHPVLLRQLRRAGVLDIEQPQDPQKWSALLEKISAAYRESEDDRYLLERSLDLSSREMQQLNSRLASERNRLQVLLASIADGICALDGNGRVTWANPAAVQILNLPERDIAGFAFLENLVDHEDGGETPSMHHRATLRRPSAAGGSGVPVSYVRSNLGAEAYEGSVVVFRDITTELEDERTLREARETADRANRAKSQFLANMSHEIRTPMNGVIAVTDLLLETELNSQQRHFADLIRKSGDALLAVINDVLDLSKIEAGKVNLRDEPFSLYDTVESVVQTFAPAGREKRVEVALFADANVPDHVQGDQGKIAQSLANLVSNAIKFTEMGSVIVKLTVAAKGPDGRATIRFRVIDSGIGIRPESLTILFKPFSQVDGSETRRYSGTGLGLAISKHLIELMGGSIWVESELGKGSCFFFEIPLKGTQAAPAPTFPPTRVVVVHRLPSIAGMLVDQVTDWTGQQAVACGFDSLNEALAPEYGATTLLLDFDHPGVREQAAERLQEFARSDGNNLVVLACMQSKAAAEAWVDREWNATVLAKPILPRVLSSCLRGRSKNTAVPPAGDQVLEMGTPQRSICGAPPRARKVLIVEDSLINQFVAREMLRKLGFIPAQCSNGLQAVQLVRQSEFDAILMDCQMPEMDGFKATEEIRAYERELGSERRIPIIALTANALIGDRERCLAAGMDDYLAKPLQLLALQSALAAWLPTTVTPAI